MDRKQKILNYFQKQIRERLKKKLKPLEKKFDLALIIKRKEQNAQD